MTNDRPLTFHLHLISDATGETLTAMSKAVSVQYAHAKPIEHVHPLVRTQKQLDRALKEVELNPGIVLFTIVNNDLSRELEKRCAELNLPCLAVLETIMKVFSAYLGAPSQPTVAGQHTLDAEYFRRIDALNFTLLHDDGQLPDDIDQADIVLIGVSRTTKTPTSIYLANRGFKTINIPIVPGIEMPPQLQESGKDVFIVGLIASAERIANIRRNRLKELAAKDLNDYVDLDIIKAEITFTRRMCAQNNWPVIDVTRRSIEETAAAILRLYHDRKVETLDLG